MHSNIINLVSSRRDCDFSSLLLEEGAGGEVLKSFNTKFFFLRFDFCVGESPMFYIGTPDIIFYK